MSAATDELEAALTAFRPLAKDLEKLGREQAKLNAQTDQQMIQQAEQMLKGTVPPTAQAIAFAQSHEALMANQRKLTATLEAYAPAEERVGKAVGAVALELGGRPLGLGSGVQS